MSINMDQAKGLLEKSAAQAEALLTDPSKVDEILIQLEEKLKEVPVIGQTLSELPLMVAMIKGYITKQYSEVSPKVIALMLGSIIYLLKKDDFIDDRIPLLGLTDDLVVLGLALKLSENELNAFSEWRKSQQGRTSEML